MAPADAAVTLVDDCEVAAAAAAAGGGASVQPESCAELTSSDCCDHLVSLVNSDHDDVDGNVDDSLTVSVRLVASDTAGQRSLLSTDDVD